MAGLATIRNALLAIGLISLTTPHTAAAQELPLLDSDSDSDNQIGLTFSPDGETAYWVVWDGTWGSSSSGRRVIVMSRLSSGSWTEPVPMPFSQSYSDNDPFVSPDGQWLYFTSERPANENDTNLDADIWRYSLVEEDRLERLSVNSVMTEYSPVVTSSGALYFASARDGGDGQGDLYRAPVVNDGFGAPELLGPAMNSRAGEWNLWVSADETEIIFEASSRPTNISVPGDLYYSWRTTAGWTAATPIAPLNSKGSDLMPRLHPNGEVTFVDLSRGEVVDRIATGEGPHLLSNVSDGKVLATGYGEFPRPHAEPVSRRPPFVEALNSRLTIIDAVSRTALLDTVIAGCLKPHHSWIIAERAYVTCQSEQRVLELDLRDGRPVRQFETQQDGSHVLSFDPVSRTLAASNTDSGSITLIDIDSGSTEVVELAAGSEGALAVNGRFWVANAFAGSVSVVDPSTNTVVEQVDSVCQFPIALSQDSWQQVWVACFASAELAAIGIDDFAVTRRISLDNQPLHVLMHPERDLAYVSLPRKNAVAEIDMVSGKELRRFDVGIEPDGLRWAPSAVF